MKNCTGCKHADWQKTANGRLHPSGEGLCRFKYKVPSLPACQYWLGREPEPMGGFINRKREHKNHCPYYARNP